MMYQPATVSDNLNTLPKLPGWVTSGRAETFEAVAFRSGAALTVLDQLVSDPSQGVPVKLLANQLALQAATATSRLEGRLAREADIRDAYHLTPPGEARGPDGDILTFWRDAARLKPTGPDWHEDVQGLVGAAFTDDVVTLIASGATRAKTEGPLAGCVAVMRAVLEADDRAERIASLLSDIVLARALNWTSILPVTAHQLTKAMLRELTNEGQWADLRIQTSLLNAIEGTIRLARDLATRAAALRAVTPKLRAKGSEAAADLFLSEDAIGPSMMLSPTIQGTTIPMTDRAARRFCDRNGGAGRRAGTDRAVDVPAVWDCAMTRTAMTSDAKRENSQPKEAGREGVFDRELEDLPQELRWREWMGRIEAVLFASATPIGRNDLARVVGQGASVEMLIEDIQAELAGRPYELMETAGGWMFRNKTQFAAAIKAAADLGDQALAFNFYGFNFQSVGNMSRLHV